MYNNFIPNDFHYNMFFIDIASKITTFKDCTDDIYLFNALYDEQIWVVVVKDSIVSTRNMKYNIAYKEAHNIIKNDFFITNVKIIINPEKINASFCDKMYKKYCESVKKLNDKRFNNFSKVLSVIKLLKIVYFEDYITIFKRAIEYMEWMSLIEFFKAITYISPNNSLNIFSIRLNNKENYLIFYGDMTISYLLSNKLKFRPFTDVELTVLNDRLAVKYNNHCVYFEEMILI